MGNEKPSNSRRNVPLQGLGVGTMVYGSSPIIFENAKRLRIEPIESEIIFWSLLKQHFSSFRFKRQHPISNYIADFYCYKLKLVIVIDGSTHLTGNAKNNDKLRDEYMQSLDLKIVRFTNEEVYKNGELVVKKLKEMIEVVTQNQNRKV